MLTNLYNNYFAKDKSLRHYTQHIFVGFVGFFVVNIIFGLPPNSKNILVFICFGILVDLDGIFTVFVTQKNMAEAKLIRSKLKSFKLKLAATLATRNHKKINRLLLHNIIGLAIIIILFIYSLNIKSQFGISAFGAILTYFAFDIFDDMYQLGHIKNWLWPVRKNQS